MYMGNALVGPYKSCPPGTLKANCNRRTFSGAGRCEAWMCRVIEQPKAPPRPRPAPQPVNFAPTITVTPNFQQQFTPQFSPVLQQSSGSGSQSAAPTQESRAPQSAGLDEAALQRILDAQARALQSQRAMMEREQAARDEEQRLFRESLTRDREQQKLLDIERQKREAQAQAERDEAQALENERLAQEQAQEQERARIQEEARMLHSQRTGSRSLPMADEAIINDAIQSEKSPLPAWLIPATIGTVLLPFILRGKKA